MSDKDTNRSRNIHDHHEDDDDRHEEEEEDDDHRHHLNNIQNNNNNNDNKMNLLKNAFFHKPKRHKQKLKNDDPLYKDLDPTKVNYIFNSRYWSSVVDNNNNSNKKQTQQSNHLLQKPPPAIINPNKEEPQIQIGSIFISLTSFRDSKRCGETLLSIFQNALHPLNVTIGLVEQNHPFEDTTNIYNNKINNNKNDQNRDCVEYYCHLQQKLHTSTSTSSCPYQDQIKSIQLSSYSAKGPSFARALSQRKLLSNEQYCMSIDSHSKLIQHWDDVVKNEWKMIDNEFGVLSNMPAVWWKYPKKDDGLLESEDVKRDQQMDGDVIGNGNVVDEEMNMDELATLIKNEQNVTPMIGDKRVYRSCIVLFNDYAIPVSKLYDVIICSRNHLTKVVISNSYYVLRIFNLKFYSLRSQVYIDNTKKHHHEFFDELLQRHPRKPPRIKEAQEYADRFAHSGIVQNLLKPILSYTWSSSFSFSKCHLETNVPYDNFITQWYDTEEFTRYARMFTRGYDVYTPTRNIVYHDYFQYQNVNKYGYLKSRTFSHSEKEKRVSIKRVHNILGILRKDGDDAKFQKKHGSFGIYGLGKLRSLEQLESFIGINLRDQRSNQEHPTCSNLQWVPYNSNGNDYTIRPNVNITTRKLLAISPMDNLYLHSSGDLDPQPEFPKRDISRKTLAFYFNDLSSLVDQSSLIDQSDPLETDSIVVSNSNGSDYHYNMLILICLVIAMIISFYHCARRSNRNNNHHNKSAVGGILGPLSRITFGSPYKRDIKNE